MIGKNGLISYVSLKKKLAIQAEQVLVMKCEKCALQKNIDLLSNNSIDLDLLEERGRVVLNYAFADEAIVRIQK